MHADFLRIRLDERIQTTVSVVLTGQAEGVTLGGVLDHQLREVEVECLALDVPEEFALDITSLQVGDSLHVSDITAVENVTILTDPARAVAAILAPRVVEAIFGIVERIKREQRVSVLLVEQNASLALEMADRAYLLETGYVVTSGSAKALADDPQIRRSYLGY